MRQYVTSPAVPVAAIGARRGSGRRPAARLGRDYGLADEQGTPDIAAFGGDRHHLQSRMTNEVVDNAERGQAARHRAQPFTCGEKSADLFWPRARQAAQDFVGRGKRIDAVAAGIYSEEGRRARVDGRRDAGNGSELLERPSQKRRRRAQLRRGPFLLLRARLERLHQAHAVA